MLRRKRLRIYVRFIFYYIFVRNWHRVTVMRASLPESSADILTLHDMSNSPIPFLYMVSLFLSFVLGLISLMS